MAKTELEIARLDLVNARAAVDALPLIEERAWARVNAARNRLAQEEAELARVLREEIPAGCARVSDLEAQVHLLEQQEQ